VLPNANLLSVTKTMMVHCMESSSGLMVRIAGVTCNESWVQIPEKPMVAAGRASDLNSFLSSNKVSLLTGEQTPRPHTEINNVEITP